MATAQAVQTMGMSLPTIPSTTQIGATSTPRMQRSRTLSLRSRSRGMISRSSIEEGIGRRTDAKIPRSGVVA
jgi:hypothetical protein